MITLSLQPEWTEILLQTKFKISKESKIRHALYNKESTNVNDPLIDYKDINVTRQRR